MSRRPAASALASLIVICVLLAGCAGSSAGDSGAPTQLTPADTQRYVTVKDATSNMTQLIQLISTADDTVAHLVAAKPGSPLARRYADGGRTGWNNVIVGLNGFTNGEAAAVDGLADAVSATRQVAIDWDTALQQVQTAQRGGTASRSETRRALMGPHRDELKARDRLRGVVATLAKLTCDMERAHPELNTPGGTASSCAAAQQLGQG
jgi:hypothetical protein